MSNKLPRGAARRVPLRVLYAQRRGRPKPVARASSRAKWRAGIMIGVYVLMIAHVVHWSITGTSVSRFVLSDSMRTLELGEINPGFLLFAAALLVTLVCGRFLCGWACHMAGLQDLCAWVLRRCGVRPRMFKSRLLGYIPLGLALYMFVWPAVKREAVAPLLRSAWPRAAALLGEPMPMPELRVQLTTAALWEGLPTWAVGVPFLLICGFATVYFLGARGLCRYGCPYGGFFLPLEQLAPGRIVVDAARCDQCGLCTGACTVGVRVHDEVRAYGMVTDRNCVRSMDCVAACPHGALKLGFAMPPVFSRRGGAGGSQHYDLTMGEEVVVAAVFVAALAVLRGLYGAIPLLMAATMAGLVGFFAWKCLRMRRDRDVRVGGAQVKRAGRVLGAGWAFIAAVGVGAGLLAHSAAVRASLWWGSRLDERVNVPLMQVLDQRGAGVPADARREASGALRWYERGLSWRRGGIGLADTPEVVGRLAWLKLVAGDWTGAERELRSAWEEAEDKDLPAVNLARVLLAQERAGDAEEILADVIKRQPGAWQSRDLLCWMWASSGREDRAEREYRAALERAGDDLRTRAGLGRLLLGLARPAEAAGVLAPAAAASPRDVGIRSDYAAALFQTEGVERGLRELQDAAAALPEAKGHYYTLAGSILRRVGRASEAAKWEAWAGGP